MTNFVHYTSQTNRIHIIWKIVRRYAKCLNGNEFITIQKKKIYLCKKIQKKKTSQRMSDKNAYSMFDIVEGTILKNVLTITKKKEPSIHKCF